MSLVILLLCRALGVRRRYGHGCACGLSSFCASVLCFPCYSSLHPSNGLFVHAHPSRTTLYQSRRVCPFRCCKADIRDEWVDRRNALMDGGHGAGILVPHCALSRVGPASIVRLLHDHRVQRAPARVLVEFEGIQGTARCSADDAYMAPIGAPCCIAAARCSTLGFAFGVGALRVVRVRTDGGVENGRWTRLCSRLNAKTTAGRVDRCGRQGRAAVTVAVHGANGGVPSSCFHRDVVRDDVMDDGQIKWKIACGQETMKNRWYAESLGTWPTRGLVLDWAGGVVRVGYKQRYNGSRLADGRIQGLKTVKVMDVDEVVGSVVCHAHATTRVTPIRRGRDSRVTSRSTYPYATTQLLARPQVFDHATYPSTQGRGRRC